MAKKGFTILLLRNLYNDLYNYLILLFKKKSGLRRFVLLVESACYQLVQLLLGSNCAIQLVVWNLVLVLQFSTLVTRFVLNQIPYTVYFSRFWNSLLSWILFWLKYQHITLALGRRTCDLPHIWYYEKKIPEKKVVK